MNDKQLSDFNLLMAIICLVALITVALDVFVWRESPPTNDPTCVKPEPRNAKAIEIYNNGCIK